MYRRRRLVLVLVLLLIAAGITFAIWQPWRGAAAEGTRTPGAASATPTVTPTTTPEVTPRATPTGADGIADSPASTPTPPAPCTTSSISVLAVTDKDAYRADEQPQLSITLSNKGEVPCLMDVGTATQEFVITSGSDTWWRSTDCQTEPSSYVVELAAGQTVSNQTPLVWDRTRSSVDSCDDGARRQRAGSGTFHLQVSIGGIQAADTRMFVLR